MRERIPVSEPSLTPRAKEYVLDCLDSGWISSQGPYVERLEREFAAVAGVEQIGRASCRERVFRVV